MEIFEGRYYKSCTWFLKFIGLWPYLSETRKKFSCVIFFLINASLTFPLMIVYIDNVGKNIYITIENSVAIMFSVAILAKYTVTMISSNRLKILFEQISNDWQRLVNKSEREILTRNSEQGRTLLLFYTGYSFAAWVLYSCIPSVPLIMDKLFPLNESRPMMVPVYADYIFFDRAEHNYSVCVHVAAVYLTSWFLFSGVDTTFVLSVKHTCGLFNILCHRFDCLLKSEKDIISTKLTEDASILRILRSIVVLHDDTIRCSKLLENSFSTSFLILNLLSVIGLALTGVYIVFFYNDVYKMMRIVPFLCGLILHLFYINWVGQMLIDESEKVFTAVYFSNWYLISPKLRVVIDIVMMRSIFPSQLTAGKISVLSMESFGSLAKTTMSYFTIFGSVT